MDKEIFENKRTVNTDKIIDLGQSILTSESSFLLNGTFQPRVYQLFFDFEMTGIHKETTPISLGIISDTGKTFYAEFTDFDKNQVDEWIAENVIAKTKYISNPMTLPFAIKGEHDFEIYGTKEAVAYALSGWLKENFQNYVGLATDGLENTVMNRIEFVGDCCAYDWMLMTDLIGTYQEDPSIKNMLLIDIDAVPSNMDFKDTEKMKAYLANVGTTYIQPMPRKVGLPTYPAGVNYIPTDLCTMFKDRGIDPDVNREEFVADVYTIEGDDKHNALHDARIIRASYLKLKDLDTTLAYQKVGDDHAYRQITNELYEDSQGNVYRMEFTLVKENND